MDTLTNNRMAAASERTSDILARFARETGAQDVTVGTVIDALKNRGFGIVIILFALPSAVLPLAWILGTPILFFAVQLILGLREPWLPEVLRRPVLNRETFTKFMDYAIKYLGIIEEALRPRWTWLTSPIAERIIGVYIVFLTLALLVPIVPLGNALPAFGIGIIAAGLLERDGVAILVGSLAGAIGSLYVLAFIGGAWAALMAIFGL